MSSKEETSSQKIRRVFNGLSVVDAEADIRVYIHDEDIKTASKKDFANCVIANTCKRAFDSGTVAILKNVAYVEVPDEDGNRRVERFEIGAKARELIIQYDTGKEVGPGSCFILKAPRPSNRLDGLSARKKAERNKQRDHKAEYEKKKEKKQVRIKGEISSKYNPNKSDLTLLDVRNGTGAVQMRRRD